MDSCMGPGSRGALRFRPHRTAPRHFPPAVFLCARARADADPGEAVRGVSRALASAGFLLLWLFRLLSTGGRKPGLSRAREWGDDPDCVSEAGHAVRGLLLGSWSQLRCPTG